MSTRKARREQPVEYPVREIELNPRAAPMAANRVAFYSSPFDVRVRFLHAVTMPPTMLHPDETVLEIANVADISLHISVAKRMVIDLEASIRSFEEHMGTQPSVPELDALWSARGTKQ